MKSKFDLVLDFLLDLHDKPIFDNEEFYFQLVYGDAEKGSFCFSVDSSKLEVLLIKIKRILNKKSLNYTKTIFSGCVTIYLNDIYL